MPDGRHTRSSPSAGAITWAFLEGFPLHLPLSRQNKPHSRSCKKRSRRGAIKPE
jgi:hypothetical protein